MGNEYQSGLGTTHDMWKMLSEILETHQEKLPMSLNNAIHALCQGNAIVVANDAILLTHCRNNFLKTLKALKLADSQLDHSQDCPKSSTCSDKPCRCGADERRKLIKELEEVKR